MTTEIAHTTGELFIYLLNDTINSLDYTTLKQGFFLYKAFTVLYAITI
jgi:hypothetical protein